MRVNFIFLILYLLSSSQNNYSQEIVLAKKTAVIPLQDEKFLGFDYQQNLYLIQNNNLIKKNKQDYFEYKNLSLGNITRVDFQNPLQIVVFYNDFNSVVLLDNQLNETKKIDFSFLSETMKIEAIALSSQNQIWFYDAISSKIGLYSFTNDTFKWISTPLPNSIKEYSANYTHFYWVDAKNNFYSTSIYGNIRVLEDFPIFEKIQFASDKIVLYSNDNQLFYYEMTARKSRRIKIDEKYLIKFFLADGILSIFTQNEITNYKLILP